MNVAHTDLHLAHQAADRADAVAMRHFRTGDVAWQRAKAGGSPVSAADHEVEHTLRTLITAASPTDAFLGEEFGAHGRSRRRWIVDPIDGTASFLAGEPEWGTLIALADGDTVLLGMVSAPACARRWWAVPGAGAWSAALPMDPHTSASPLAVTAATSLQDAAIGIWPPPARLSAGDRRLAARVAAQARSTVPAVEWDGPTASASSVISAVIRKPSTGSGTCHGALLVATGRLDAFLLAGAGPWDVAPLVPIVREAGGAYSELSEGRGGDTITALFSAPSIHQQILDIAKTC
ncbi:histidinol-phosphatase [Catenulispora sp. EB89]|uniref:inositol monophosphatase family protein n=1 Tax=Catenulispora sp. EB89 TaxID=3156257 RepID=UPI003518723E